jgi:uncharacterized protein YbjQ (UPF0145 family)
MSEKKKDLTRIEDLSEFLHEEDSELDKILGTKDRPGPEESEDPEELPSLDDLEAEQDPPELDEMEEFKQDEQDNDPTNPGLRTEELEDEDEDSLNFGDDENDSQWGSSDEVDWSTSEDDSWGDEAGDTEDTSQPEESWQQTKDETPFTEDDSDSLPPDEQLDEAEIDLEEEPEPEPEPEPGPPKPHEIKTKRSPPENFEDVKQFAQTMTYGHVGAGGNPPFSVMLKNIKYKEDAEDILSLLTEHNIVDEKNLSNYQQSIENGALLISQISEYSAIYLAHRLRRFDLDIMVGLADEMHPSKSYESTHKGLLSKHNLRQNKVENVSLKEAPDGPEQIKVSTTPGLEGHRVHKYLGIITEHSLLTESHLDQIQHEALNHDELPLEKEINDVQERLKDQSEGKDNDELVEKYAMSIQHVYGELVERLKSGAIKLKANAVVGISFHLTPLIDKKDGPLENSYKVTCSGNAVWVSAQGDPE